MFIALHVFLLARNHWRAVRRLNQVSESLHRFILYYGETLPPEQAAQFYRLQADCFDEKKPPTPLPPAVVRQMADKIRERKGGAGG